MQDFTIDAYRSYLKALQSAYYPILRFDRYLRLEVKPDSFVMIRHDVDRRPLKALKMAQLEHSLGIQSTYFFRSTSSVFKPWIIKATHRLGHEIGYHYETLSDTWGNYSAAIHKFIINLNTMRKVAPVATVSMHGRPLSRYNNLDLLKVPEFHTRLIQKCRVLGEVYLDIDYRDIAYICDTGRNWNQNQANLRDHVSSDVRVELKNKMELLDALKTRRWKKIVFQIHPERWADNTIDYMVQYISDTGINLIKKML